jgi:hypothetical protein
MGLSTGPGRDLEVINDGRVELGIVEVNVIDMPSRRTRKCELQLQGAISWKSLVV